MTGWGTGAYALLPYAGGPPTNEVNAAGIAPAAVASILVDVAPVDPVGEVQAAGVAAAAVASMRLAGGSDSQINRTYGWTREARAGTITWTPPVVPPPAGVLAQQQVVAQAFTMPTIEGTHVRLTPTYVREPAHRDRIIVAGRDITFYRGVPTLTPDYQQIQPLGHGAASFELPQVAMPFETPGQGDLTWLAKEATVLVQRVDTATGLVVATDWRGFIAGFDMSGGTLRVECAGEAVGRAALQDRQMQLVQLRPDAGDMIARAIRNLRLRHDPPQGTVTGIPLIRWGGGGMLDFINELVSKMNTVDGDQWTVMPGADGAYRTTLKDLDTIHGTVYLDDARVKGDLRTDLAEEPNRIFASAVTPEGMVVKFGAYPGLLKGDPAPYPFDDNASFGIGTTNASTDTGDGITVMLSRLWTMGYLDPRPTYVTYDAEAGEAIRDLKREAGLTPVNATMTPNAWRALFDVSSTGYSLRNIRVEPAAQTSAVQKWRLSASGAIIARNPNFVPSRIPVDRTIAMGSGFTRRQVRTWSRNELSAGERWRGTIEISTGAIVAGDHTPGDPIGSILRARDIKPGMNLSLPLFAGGIVVHVAGVSVTSQGTTVTLAVDTTPGDTIPVWAAIQRDRDNRNTVHRSFNAQRRAASLERENTFDEVGGVTSPVKLNAGTWTVFPVVAKQAGTIQRVAVRLAPQREFVMAVFGRRITPARLRRVTNAPLTPAGAKRWTEQNVHDALNRDHVLLYVAGNDEQPCGYSPGEKGDGQDLTGRFEDDASFPFVTYSNDTDRGSVLWVAVWTANTATLAGGRIMWPSAEEY